MWIKDENGYLINTDNLTHIYVNIYESVECANVRGGHHTLKRFCKREDAEKYIVDLHKDLNEEKSFGPRQV